MLARLALAGGHVVPIADLVDDVWGAEPVDTAAATLQNYVSILRKALAPATIERIGAGYRLAGATVDVEDLEQEVRVVRDAGQGARVAALADIVRRWPSAPLADAGDGRVVSAHRQRLRELGAELADALTDARLEAGEHDTEIKILRERLEQDPHRERTARQLAVALYRSGRQTDALAVLSSLRRLLVEDLGVDPSPPTEAIERQILHHADELSTPVTTGIRSSHPRLPLPDAACLEHGRSELIGRRTELQHLLQHLDGLDRVDGVPPVVWIEGDAGIGKSRLARELALAGWARGANVVWGRSVLDSDIGLLPIVDAFDHVARFRPDLIVEDMVLAALLPALRDRRSDPLSVLRPSDLQRGLLHAAVRTTLEQAAREAPVLFFVDDLQWADSGSLAVLEHLAVPAIAGVLIVGTVRAPEPTTTPLSTRLRDRLARAGRLDRFELRGLSRDEIRAFLDASTGSATSDANVVAVERQTSGNPFFIGEIVSMLGDTASERLAGGQIDVPAGVRAILDERFRVLDDDDCTVLAAAAMVDTGPDVSTCVAVTGLPTDRVATAIERAVELRLVVEHDRAGQFDFVHGLMRAAALDRVSSARRNLMLERLQRVRHSADDRIGSLGRRLTGRRLAQPSVDVVSSDRADDRLIDSRRFIDRIVTTGEATPDRRPVGEVAVSDSAAGHSILALARTWRVRGRRADALRRSLECASLARHLDDAPLLVASAVEAVLASGRWAGAPDAADPRVDLVVSDALATSGVTDDRQLAQLLCAAAVAAADRCDRTRAELLTAAAARAAARVSDAAVLGEVELATRLVRVAVDDAGARLVHARRAIDLASEAGDESLATRARVAAVLDLVALGRVDEAADQLALFAPNGAAAWRHFASCTVAMAKGDETEASASIERAAACWAGVDTADDPLATAMLSMTVRAGMLADSTESLAEAAERWPESLLWRAASAIAAQSAGDHASAARQLDAIESNGLLEPSCSITAAAGHELHRRLRSDDDALRGRHPVPVGWAGAI